MKQEKKFKEAYGKAKKVINSCTTAHHVSGARKYLNLFILMFTDKVNERVYWFESEHVPYYKELKKQLNKKRYSYGES
tara:strand:- start:558 stop:791 length:234 start_codon:yes stop_codon:yes gene_type:complete